MGLNKSAEALDRSAYLFTPNITTGLPPRFEEMGFNEADFKKRILDVGCGCSGAVLKFGEQIYGIDPNLGQFVQNGLVIDSAPVVVPERSMRALAEELPFADESFDITYSVKAVGWYPRNINLEMALREMLRVTKKETGIVCFNVGQEMTRGIINPVLHKLNKEGFGINVVRNNWIYMMHKEFNPEIALRNQ